VRGDGLGELHTRSRGLNRCTLSEEQGKVGDGVDGRQRRAAAQPRDAIRERVKTADQFHGEVPFDVRL